MMCDDCIHAGRVGGFPDGEDMFVCNCRDPRVPFDMDEGTVCPCYRKVKAEGFRSLQDRIDVEGPDMNAAYPKPKVR